MRQLLLCGLLASCDAVPGPVLPDPSTVFNLELLPKGSDSMTIAITNEDTRTWQVGRCGVWGQILDADGWRDDTVLGASGCPNNFAVLVLPGQTWRATLSYRQQQSPIVARLRLLVAPEEGEGHPSTRYQALHSYSFTID